MDLALFIEQYGLWVAVLLLVLTNPQAQKFIKNIVGQVVPSLGRRWEAEQARELREWEQAERDRADAVLIAKDMISTYRTELQEAKLERNRDHGKLLDIIGQYERTMASFVEVLRDLSDLVRVSSERIREMYPYVVRRDRGMTDGSE